MKLWAVVPAAGSGSRMGAGVAKQLLPLHGRSMLTWTVEALLASPRVSGCMLALSEEVGTALPQELASDPRVMRCEGGATRADSVANALAAIDAEAEDWALVHDAARPCLPLDALERLIDSVLARGIGGLLAQPLADTLKRGDQHGMVVETLPRERLWRAQTPQMFRVGELREALAAARDAGVVVTDEASAMEFCGRPVQLVEGPACNIKVTYDGDLGVAAAWLSGGRGLMTG